MFERDLGVRDIAIRQELAWARNSQVVEAGGEPVLSFHHALVQDTAYARILRRHRRDLHRKVAQVAEELYGAGDNAIDLLARHLYLGDAGAKALDYLNPRIISAAKPLIRDVGGTPVAFPLGGFLQATEDGEAALVEAARSIHEAGRAYLHQVRVLEAASAVSDALRPSYARDADPMVRAQAIGTIADEKVGANATLIAASIDDPDVIVRYLVHPKEAGRVKSRLIKKLLAELNKAPERVMFPKGDAR